MIPACVPIRFRLAFWCLFQPQVHASAIFPKLLSVGRPPARQGSLHSTHLFLALARSLAPPSLPPSCPSHCLALTLALPPRTPPTSCPFSHSQLAVMGRSVSDSSRGRDNCAFTGCCRSKAADGNSSHTHERNFGSRAGKVSHAASAFNMCIILCSPQGWLLRVSWPGGGRVELWHAVVLGQRLHG